MSKRRPRRVSTEAARTLLRRFAAFCDQQDPEALANAATNIPDTLDACHRLQIWFARYTTAIERRKPQ
jgi:hypothetical protein